MYSKESFDLQFDLHLFLQEATVNSRDDRVIYFNQQQLLLAKQMNIELQFERFYYVCAAVMLYDMLYVCYACYYGSAAVMYTNKQKELTHREIRSQYFILFDNRFHESLLGHS